jgi:hypothetical protein
MKTIARDLQRLRNSFVDLGYKRMWSKVQTILETDTLPRTIIHANVTNAEGYTLLHFAVLYCDTPAVQWLIQTHNASVEAVASTGHRIVDSAVMSRPDILRAVLAAPGGSSPTTLATRSTFNGLTPLEGAVRHFPRDDGACLEVALSHLAHVLPKEVTVTPAMVAMVRKGDVPVQALEAVTTVQFECERWSGHRKTWILLVVCARPPKQTQN